MQLGSNDFKERASQDSVAIARCDQSENTLIQLDSMLSPNKFSSKYFFIGLTATGNYTAATAMHMLGYRAAHFPTSLAWILDFDVLTDTPVAFWFRLGLLPLDATFVLTVREIESWLEACQVWFESRPLSTLDPFTQQVRWYLYGGLTFERERFINCYWNHLEQARKLAQKYGLNLVEWNLVENPQWDFLCNLTLQDVPSQPFPFKFDKQYKRGTWQGVLNTTP
ncbi:hypothetical protein F7734_12975 [Scytonema sp. UIC 10036]|uniref:sulfotransferase n=1 Tax=Scytonema sp. UIC 10036 TaxID=2304196 RepID=UPI0012DA2B51|nr:sulfotransferase [Scytonema sp. UIC 10036]MUG93291.1 hypothetical protein [Scytonema sp. UIC 10036]